MSDLPEITLVIGIDAKTIEQLKISWRTWKKSRPQMWHWPMLLFYDKDQLKGIDVYKFVANWGWQGRHRIVEWPPADSQASYESQRERMLSGHVFVPAQLCATKWHAKIDTDALARDVGEWPQIDWFDGDPAWVCPRWGYTKGFNFLPRLDNWGDGVRELKDRSPLRIPQSPGQLRVGHARMCSWCSFYRTNFTISVARACEESCGPYRLPVPSQDTVAWYVAERMGMPTRTVAMKKFGWSNHSRIDELRRVAAEIMGERSC